MLLEPLSELISDNALDHRTYFGGDELILGLRGKFRIGHLDRQHAGEALAHIFAGQRHPFLFGNAAVIGIGVDCARQRRTKPGEMGSAIALWDVVGETQHRFVIAVGPFHRDFNKDVVALAADHDR